MSSHSSDVPEPPLDSPAVAPQALPATRPLYWSVRRELWENRSIYIAPLVVAAVALFAYSISTIGLPARIRAVLALDPAQQPHALAAPYAFAATAIIVTTLIVGAFYSLEALHAERRDRSILFWKSLPVSDLTTVLSKASIPLVVLPLLAFAIVVPTQIFMLLLSTLVLPMNGLSPALLWTRLPLFSMSLVMLYGLAVHALWFAPVYGWLLLVSGWARRATLLWAVLPVAAIGVVEKIVFNTSHFGSLLRYRLTGAMREAFVTRPTPHVGVVIERTAELDPARFLGSPGLWSGLLVAGAFLALAIRARRNREPI